MIPPLRLSQETPEMRVFSAEMRSLVNLKLQQGKESVCVQDFNLRLQELLPLSGCSFSWLRGQDLAIASGLGAMWMGGSCSPRLLSGGRAPHLHRVSLRSRP